MLHILAFTFLLTAAAAQPTFYCNSSTPSLIKSLDFYLVTRSNASDTTYPGGLLCQFQAELDYPYRGYLVEIQTFQVDTAVLTIESGITVFQGSRLASYQSTIATSATGLSVRFNASRDYSRYSGVKIRVRAFELSGCPPGWTFMLGNCYGTSNTVSHLNFNDAQKACNSMRSNLLEVPITHWKDIRSFVSLLPTRLKSYYTWIGMTDKTSAGQYRLYWLSGDRQLSTSGISCVSGGSYSSCYSFERCATIYDKSSPYAVFMDNCNDLNTFACSMPPWGTSNFYRVPDGDSGITDYPRTVAPRTVSPPTSYRTASWVWGLIAAGLFVVGALAIGVYRAARSSNARRNPGAASVVVTSGQVTLHPPSTAYPVQRPTYPQQNPQHPQQYPTDKDLNAPPPPYHTVVGAGYANSGMSDNS